jgi:hypothetical protein
MISSASKIWARSPEHLLEAADRTSFDLRDRYEYWLLDEHVQPLARFSQRDSGIRDKLPRQIGPKTD